MKICSIPGCGKKHWAKGLCYNHYRYHWYKNAPITKLCSIEGCKNRHWGNGLCKNHFNKFWYKNHPNYKKEYYKRNQEKMILQARIWRKNNSEHFRKYMRERQNIYYKNHKQEIDIWAKNWRKNNKERLREMARKRYAKNPYKYLLQSKTRGWWKKNPERARENARKSREKHKEKRYKNSRDWIKRNPEKARFNYKKRHWRERNAIGSHTYKEWMKIRDETNGWCKGIKRNPHFVGIEKLTEDHIIPLKLGGTNFIDNIQPLCLSCNSRKQDIHPQLL